MGLQFYLMIYPTSKKPWYMYYFLFETKSGHCWVMVFNANSAICQLYHGENK